jgi:hypothetical protein
MRGRCTTVAVNAGSRSVVAVPRTFLLPAPSTVAVSLGTPLGTIFYQKNGQKAPPQERAWGRPNPRPDAYTSPDWVLQDSSPQVQSRLTYEPGANGDFSHNFSKWHLSAPRWPSSLRIEREAPSGSPGGAFFVAPPSDIVWLRLCVSVHA